MRFRSTFLAAGFLLASAVASAQSFTPVRELKNLSPSALEKLHTLETLNALPPGDWRFHAGDLPHGESATLDDSSWQVQPAPTSRTTYIKSTKEAVWYRKTIEIPKTLYGYDLTGSRIWFQFRSTANGPMPEIIYVNGRRVALGDDLEPIVLTEPAHPGDRFLVAVKLLHTVDEKTWEGVNMRIEPATDSTRPDPNDIRVQVITAANLLPALPTPRKDLLPKVESAIAAVDFKALAAANQPAFDASLLKAQSILAELHPVLAQANITLAGNAHIDAAWLWPRSETIDVVRRTFNTALQLMNEYPGYTYSQSAAQYTAWIADKYPDMNAEIKKRVQEGRWEIVGGMWVEPDLNIPDGESLVRQLLVGQRLFQKEYGVTARIGWNPDSFGYNWQLPQIYKRSGLDYFLTQKMHWNDTNQLPFRLFWWESPDGSKVLTYFPTDYVHDNVNPTRISADFAESAARNPGTVDHLDLYGIGDHGGGPTRDMLDGAEHWMKLEGTAPSEESSSSRPEREARSGETPAFSKASAAGTSKSTAAALPDMHYGTAQSFFTKVETHLNPTSPTWNYDSIAGGYTAPPTGPNGALGLPTWKDELYFEYHRGIFTSQAKHKANNRKSEAATLDAEKLSSFAWLMGQPYPAADLTENWKKITFNQFHDLAAGSGIGVIYRDAQKDYTEVFNSDKLISDNASHQISSAVNTSTALSGAVPVIVTNTLAAPVASIVTLTAQLPSSASSAEVVDEDGHPYKSQITNKDERNHTFTLLASVPMPALGYKVVFVQDSAKVKKTAPQGPDDSGVRGGNTANGIGLSNGILTVLINSKDGCISSIQDQNRGQQYLAPSGCGNQLQTYADTPKNYDAWNIDPGTLDKPMTPISTVDSIKLVTDGPLRKTVRIERTWQKSHFTQDISLDAGADFVRVDTTVDWHESHVLLKAAFPLAATSAKATFEIPYGSIQRPTTRDNSFSKAQFEVPALRWADLGDDKQGVSILNDSKYGYDALGNTLRLTLLRSPTWPDPDADRGIQHFTYEIYPHTGPWQQAQTVRRGYELNNPLTAQQVFSHTGSLPATHSFASIDNPNVTLTAVKKAEDADALIFRFYEWAGKPGDVKLHIPPGATYAIESNMMEQPLPGDQHLPLTSDTVTLPIKPFEIRTVEVFYNPTKP